MCRHCCDGAKPPPLVLVLLLGSGGKGGAGQRAFPRPLICPRPTLAPSTTTPLEQFNLFGGTILKLGTTHHHDLLLRGITSLDDIGCFALTELGFGAPTHRPRSCRPACTAASALWQPAAGLLLMQFPLQHGGHTTRPFFNTPPAIPTTHSHHPHAMQATMRWRCRRRPPLTPPPMSSSSTPPRPWAKSAPPAVLLLPPPPLLLRCRC